MQRRGFIRLSAATAAFGLCAVVTSRASAQNKPHDHKAMQGAKAPRYNDLIPPFQDCTKAISACIAHCQILLAAGDRSVGRCLRTALDCDVTCGATLKAAGLNSNYTPALARTAKASMEICVKACKPHIEHHAECKACHDACLAAIEAVAQMG
jgi:Cys-rich four helix bundle protein (predicted Tat secretion target)